MSKSSEEWRIPDEWWAKIEPMLPVTAETHPLGCHRQCVSNRAAMDAIFYRLRTDCQWNALNSTDICTSSSALRRFQEWEAAGVKSELWRLGLEA